MTTAINSGLHCYRVYYFTGNFYSFKGETRKSTIIWAKDENEAEYIAKITFPDAQFGWVEPYRNSRN